MGKKLLDAQTADIAAPTDIADSNYMESIGAGPMSVHAYGVWDGAQVELYMYLGGIANVGEAQLLDGFTFIVSATKFVNVTLPGGVSLHAVLTGAGASTSITLEMQGVGLA